MSKPQNYRNKIGIYHDILKTLRENSGCIQSKIVTFVHISDHQLAPRLYNLISCHYIEKIAVPGQKIRYQNSRIEYRITEKGMHLLAIMESFDEALSCLGGAFFNA